MAIRMDPAKTAAISDWLVPKDVHHLQSSQGWATYFRSFVQGFSKLISPMIDLTTVKMPWA